MSIHDWLSTQATFLRKRSSLRPMIRVSQRHRASDTGEIVEDLGDLDGHGVVASSRAGARDPPRRRASGNGGRAWRTS